VGIVSAYPAGKVTDIAFTITIVGRVLQKLILDKGTAIEVYADKYLRFIDVLMIPRDTCKADELRKQQGMQYFQLGFDNDWLQAVLKAYCERRWYILDTGHVGLGNHNM